MKKFILEFAQRLKSETIPFFKNLMYFFGSVAAASAAALAVPEYLPKWVDPETLKTVIFGSGIGILVCKLPVNWNKTSPNDIPAVPAPASVLLVKQELDQPKDESEQKEVL
jgi:hypothetical protein